MEENEVLGPKTVVTVTRKTSPLWIVLAGLIGLLAPNVVAVLDRISSLLREGTAVIDQTSTVNITSPKASDEQKQ